MRCLLLTRVHSDRCIPRMLGGFHKLQPLAGREVGECDWSLELQSGSTCKLSSCKAFFAQCSCSCAFNPAFQKILALQCRREDLFTQR